jgi:hypothetical protein
LRALFVLGGRLPGAADDARFHPVEVVLSRWRIFYRTWPMSSTRLPGLVM